MASMWIAVALVVAPAMGQTSAPSSQDRPSGVSVKDALTTPAAPAPRQPHELRAAVSSAMRRAAGSDGPAKDAALRELVALCDEVGRDTLMVKEERIELRTTVRNRLARVAEQMQAKAKREARQQVANRGKGPAAAQLPPGGGVLAQQVGVQQGFGMGLGQGQRTGAQQVDHGQELLELIQTTIAPSSWDVNGGQGTIMYYSPLRVMVMRQTDDVHEQIADLLRQLHN